MHDHTSTCITLSYGSGQVTMGGLYHWSVVYDAVFGFMGGYF